MRLYDISLPMDHALAGWPGDAPFHWRWTQRLSDGDAVNLGELSASVHTGTHADAPFHFNPNGATIDRVDLAIYLGPARVVDVSCRERIRREDLMEHDLSNTPRLLLKTGGWSDHNTFPTSTPVIENDVPEWLAEQGIVLIGLDVPSVDALDSKDLAIHHALHRGGIAILESLDLRSVPPGIYELIALPLRLAGADASPVRAVLRSLE